MDTFEDTNNRYNSRKESNDLSCSGERRTGREYGRCSKSNNDHPTYRSADINQTWQDYYKVIAAIESNPELMNSFLQSKIHSLLWFHVCICFHLLRVQGRIQSDIELLRSCNVELLEQIIDFALEAYNYLSAVH